MKYSFKNTFFFSLLCCVGFFVMGVRGANAAVVYAKDIVGTVYYDLSAASCDDVDVTDIVGDLEVALAAAGENGILNICAGTYSGAEIDATDGLDATASNQTINGIGSVIIDGSEIDDHILANNSRVIFLSNLTIQNSYNLRYNIYLSGAGQSIINDCVISGGSKGIYINNASPIITNSYVGDFTGMIPVWIRNASSPVFNFCKMGNYQATAAFIWNQASVGQIVTINSSLMINTGTAVLMETNDNLFVANNSMFVASGARINGDLLTTSEHVIKDNTPTGNGVTLNNCLLLNSSRDPMLYGYASINGDVTINNSVFDFPRFSSARKPAAVSFFVDDYENLDYFQNVATLLEESEMSGNFSVESGLPDETGWQLLQQISDNGHNVVTQGYLGTSLTAMSGEEETVDINTAYTTVVSNLDQDYYPFIYPEGHADLDTINKVKSTGFLGSRRAVGSGDYLFDSIDIYSIANIEVEDQIGNYSSSIRKNVAPILEHIKYHGGIWIFTTHNASLFSLESWEELIAAVSDSGVSVMNFSDAINYIKDNGTTTDEMIYTRQMEDGSDFTLQPTSPAIDAGTSVGLTTDYAGNPIYGTPDIGAYEYQPTHEMSSDNPQIGESIRIYGDGKFRNTVDDSDSNDTSTADLSIVPQDSETTKWIDLNISTWQTNNSCKKTWTENGDNLGKEDYTLHTIGDLVAGRTYNVKIDDTLATNNITGENCQNGICTADTNGKITFTYTGGYSTHTFDIEDTDPNYTGEATVSNNDNDDEEDKDENKRNLNVHKVASSSTENSITLKWKTDYATRDEVRYGTNKNLKNKKKDRQKEKKHTLTIKDLEPDTIYYFRIKSEDSFDNEDTSRIHKIKTQAVPTQVRTIEATNVSTNVSTPVSTPVNCTYTVKQGDTLWSIAKQQFNDGSSYQKIIELNPQKNTKILKVGEELKLCENNNQNTTPSESTTTTPSQPISTSREKDKVQENSQKDLINQISTEESQKQSQEQSQEQKEVVWWKPWTWF